MTNTSPRKAKSCALVSLLVLMLLLTAMPGCSDDDCKTCPTCPEVSDHNEIYDGLLYVGLSGVPYLGATDIYIIDARTEEVVDSITYPQRDALALDVSPDGSYLAVSDAQDSRVYDTRTKEVTVSFGIEAVIGFHDNGQYLITHYFKTRVYSVPDFQLVHEDTLDILSEVCCSVKSNTFFAVAGHDLLYEYSLDSFKVVRTWQPHDSDGNHYSLWNFDLSNEDRLLHVIVASARGPAVVTWDLEADTLVNEHMIAAGNGEVAANPHGGDFYVTEPGPFLSYGLGTIYVFDQQTGEYSGGISLFGYNEEAWMPLCARNLVFNPDGSQLYVVCDATHWESGTVLRIDTKTRKVESLLFPDIDTYPYTIAFGPKP